MGYEWDPEKEKANYRKHRVLPTTRTQPVILSRRTLSEAKGEDGEGTQTTLLVARAPRIRRSFAALRGFAAPPSSG
jgi:uncharacterized DUF497 family protein